MYSFDFVVKLLTDSGMLPEYLTYVYDPDTSVLNSCPEDVISLYPGNLCSAVTCVSSRLPVSDVLNITL